MKNNAANIEESPFGYWKALRFEKNLQINVHPRANLDAYFKYIISSNFVKKLMITACLIFFSIACFSHPISVDPHIFNGFRDCSLNITFDEKKGAITNPSPLKEQKIHFKQQDGFASIAINSNLLGIPVSKLKIPILIRNNTLQYEATLDMEINKVIPILEKNWNYKLTFVGSDGMDDAVKNVYSMTKENLFVSLHPIANKKKTSLTCVAK